MLDQGEKNNKVRDKLISFVSNGAIMLIPIRCPTCGKPIAHKWEEFNIRVSKGEDSKKILDEMGFHRYCCRTVFITHVDLMHEIAKFRI